MRQVPYTRQLEGGEDTVPRLSAPWDGRTDAIRARVGCVWDQSVRGGQVVATVGGCDALQLGAEFLLSRLRGRVDDQAHLGTTGDACDFFAHQLHVVDIGAHQPTKEPD